MTMVTAVTSIRYRTCMYLIPWSSPVSPADLLPRTMTVTSVCCRLVTLCHGHHWCLLETLNLIPWLLSVYCRLQSLMSTVGLVLHVMAITSCLIQTLYLATTEDKCPIHNARACFQTTTTYPLVPCKL
jgi:hypothetical protein